MTMSSTYRLPFCMLLIVVLLPFIATNHRGDHCFGVPECIDTGLTCTGAHCVCLMDLGESVARFWACNVDEDCPILRGKRSRRSTDTDTADNENTVENQSQSSQQTATATVTDGLQCIPSTECPLVDGFSGYCNIERGWPPAE